MKKILLTTAACAVLATSPAFAAEGDFYVGLNGGWAKMNKVNANDNKFKSKNDAYVSAAVGYSIMDNARVGVTFDHFFNPEFTYNKTNFSNKYKLDVNSLLVNGYVDLFDVSIMKVFAGAGVGFSRMSAKNSGTINGASFSTKIKANNYFAYTLRAGVSAEVAPGVYAEGSYGFNDCGKLKILKKQIQTHQVGGGVRFEI
ncbi:MAG: porin family protein [Acinetobacter sp.]|uniref:outer membrane protein n=1 Tax=Acinetobacter sp. TaxID=472 RepID=UPI000F97CC02|nr:outer membrane beta-barrel protein [Acinetobacter sp.]RUP42017.1 MAG: porin family protein [Acinetobacter sp.]